MLRSLVCCLWVVVLFASTSDAGQWIGFGQSNNFDEDGGPVYVIGHDGRIFLNGFDLTAGGLMIKNFAVWDGIRWSDTTTGIPGINIKSLLIDKITFPID